MRLRLRLIALAIGIIVVASVGVLVATNTFIHKQNSSLPSIRPCSLGSDPSYVTRGYIANTTSGFQLTSGQQAVLSNCDWASVTVKASKVSTTRGTPTSGSWTNVPANATAWVNLDFSPCSSLQPGSDFFETISVDNVQVFNSETGCGLG